MATHEGGLPGNTTAAPHNHLGTEISSGDFNEKRNDYGTEKHEAPVAAHHDTKPAVADEEDDEDIDALIEELESQDQNVEEDEDAELEAGAARTIPEEMLQTSTRTGLSSSEVTARRKKYGMNQMKEEKENLILKFLGFFIGPIQFVMEVSSHISIVAKLT